MAGEFDTEATGAAVSRGRFLIGSTALLAASTTYASAQEDDAADVGSSHLHFERLRSINPNGGAPYEFLLQYEFPNSSSVVLNQSGAVDPSGEIGFVTDEPRLAFRDGITGSLLARVNIAQKLIALRADASSARQQGDTASFASILTTVGGEERALRVLGHGHGQISERNASATARAALYTGDTGLAIQTLSPNRTTLGPEAAGVLSDAFLKSGDVASAHDTLLAAVGLLPDQPSASNQVRTLDALVRSQIQSVIDELGEVDFPTLFNRDEAVLPASAYTTSHQGALLPAVTKASQALFQHLPHRSADGVIVYFRTYYRKFKQFDGGVRGRIAVEVSVWYGAGANGYQLQYALSEQPAGNDQWKPATPGGAVAKHGARIADKLFKAITGAIA